MVYAVRGVGKTFFCLGLGLAVATGSSFLKFTVETPHTVTYLDGEMPASNLQERLKMLLPYYANECMRGRFRIITPDRQTGMMPDLATPEGQHHVDDALDDTKLIIIDNLSCLLRSGGAENEAESWLGVQQWALCKRKEGRAVLFVHHANKNGGQRGTSKKEDLLDTVIALRRPEGYCASLGASFEVHYEKSRGFHGPDAEPFKVKLSETIVANSNGTSSKKADWTVEGLESAHYERVIELANQGYTQREIADLLKIGKSTVGRFCKMARSQGRLVTKGLRPEQDL